MYIDIQDVVIQASITIGQWFLLSFNIAPKPHKSHLCGSVSPLQARRNEMLYVLGTVGGGVIYYTMNEKDIVVLN